MAGIHTPSSSPPMFYLFKLGDTHTGQPLRAASEVQIAANLPTAPKVLSRTENGKAVQRCRVDAAAMRNIGRYLLSFGVSASDSCSRFVLCSKARKELYDRTAYPTLGLDTTLPQHRSRTSTEMYAPRQGEYPVWYFFYGTLGDSGQLSWVLGLDELPILHPARILGGVVKEWAGKYKALVDGPESAMVQGCAYLVETQKQEDELRFYETAGYEVVRCGIFMEGGRVDGCTFRFVDAAALD